MSFQISLSSNLDKRIRGLESHANRVIREEALDFLNLIRDNAVAKWPVDTGRSRAAWVVHSRKMGRRVRFQLVNRVKYTRFIHKGNAVRLLIFAPFEAGTPGLVEIIRSRIQRGK